jgi:2'-5' RNA ligase
MRCFVAVDLDNDLARHVKEIQDRIVSLDVDMKLVEPGNLHFTLRFLGEVGESEIGMIKNSVENSLKGISAFKIGIGGLGYFGGQRYVRTLLLNVDEGKGEFVKLMKNVNNHLGGSEVNKPPHLTIGRVKSGRNRELIINFIKKSRDVNIGEMIVKDVKLKKSILTGSGPVYSDLAVFKLEGKHE